MAPSMPLLRACVEVFTCTSIYLTVLVMNSNKITCMSYSPQHTDILQTSK